MHSDRLRSAAVVLLLVIVGLVIGQYGSSSQNRLNEEQSIYQSVYISLAGPNSDVGDATVFMSSPSTCDSILDKVGNGVVLGADGEALLEQFLRVNSTGALPVSLKSIEGLAPVVSLEDALRIHRAGGAFAFSPPDRVVVSLSRVAITEDERRALLCLEVPGWSTLLHLERVEKEWVIQDLISPQDTP